MMETPPITASYYASSSPSLNDMGLNLVARGADLDWEGKQKLIYAFQQQRELQQVSQVKPVPSKEPAMAAAATTPRRVVQVFIIDPHPDVPLDQCLLYKGDPKLTDATDQELFFDVDIRSLLDAHNAKRVTYRDKGAGTANNEVVKLEPARIRDLRMSVVTIATF